MATDRIKQATKAEERLTAIKADLDELKTERTTVEVEIQQLVDQLKEYGIEDAETAVESIAVIEAEADKAAKTMITNLTEAEDIIRQFKDAN